MYHSRSKYVDLLFQVVASPWKQQENFYGTLLNGAEKTSNGTVHLKHPSIYLFPSPALSCTQLQGVGVFPSCRWAGGRAHPGQFASLSQELVK